MNERIRELAKQAGIKFTPMTIDGIEYDYEDVDMDGSEDLAMFAELIVRECAKICAGTAVTNPPNDLLEGYNMGVNKAAENIKQHFGVEEDDQEDTDSACPLCGEDGGTTCGMPGCQY